MSNNLGRGKTIHSQTKNVIINVLKFMKTEAENGPINVSSVMSRVSQATGISEGTLRKIIRENEAIERGDKTCFDSPAKKRPKKTKTKVNIDSFDKEAIRRLVYNFHTTHEKLPSLREILQKIRETPAINFSGNKDTLRKILHNLGFKWAKSGDDRKGSWHKYANQPSQICENDCYAPYFININEEECSFEADEKEVMPNIEPEVHIMEMVPADPTTAHPTPLFIPEQNMETSQQPFALHQSQATIFQTSGGAVSSGNHNLPTVLAKPKVSTPLNQQAPTLKDIQESSGSHTQ